MADAVVGGIIILILGFSISRIIIAKKKGVKCIGCDAGAACGKRQAEASGCCSSCEQRSQIKSKEYTKKL